jgi:predicted MFS family arabinose efflux permease
MAWVTGPAAFVACACLAQFLTPVHGPPYAEVMRQIYPEEIRGKAMGSVRMGSSIATMMAAGIGGKLLDVVGFQPIFPVAALAGVAASWIFSQVPYPTATPDARRKPSPLRETLSQLLKETDPAFRRFEWAFFCFGFGNLMIAPLVPLLLVDEFQASRFFVGQLAFVTALSRLASLYFWGYGIDAFGALGITRTALSLMAFLPLCYAGAHSRSLLVLAAALSGCAMAGLELGVIGSMIALARRRNPATLMAVHQTVLGLRGIIAPWVGTLLLGFLGLRAVFLIGAALILSGALLLRSVNPQGGGACVTY